jgi:long-chain acyl-CoA synthetase
MKYEDKPWLKSYDPAIKPEYEIPDISLVGHYNEVFSRVPESPSIRFLGLTFTYRDLMEHSNRFAQALINNGCGPGDVVGINLPNIPQYLIAQIGALKAGCAVTGVSPLLTPGEMVHQLNDSKAKALVTADPIFEHRLLEIVDQLPNMKLVVSTGILDFLPWLKRTLAMLLKKVPSGKVQPLDGKKVLKFMDILAEYSSADPGIKVGPDDVCQIQYTGGTTGLPKGSIISHRNLIAELFLVINWLQMEPGKEVVLSGFPFFHIAGLSLGLGTLYDGHVQILIPDPRNTKLIIGEMKKFRPTILVNVPSLYMLLMEQPEFRALDFSSLGFCLSAASPFPAESINELESVIGKGKLIEGYGMTELSSLATSNPRRGEKKIGSVGLPLPNTRMRLMDLETGNTDVPIGEEGEIVVLGPQVMQGYLNKPDESAVALREHEGEIWLHTGDVARMDEDGYFTIVDRSKDMLNVGGYKVFSREVEDKLYEHPAIELCAIIGKPNPKRPGTDIVKLVYQASADHKNRDPDDLAEEIREFARAHCAPYKVPKIIELVDELPLTPIGKVDKKALR